MLRRFALRLAALALLAGLFSSAGYLAGAQGSEKPAEKPKTTLKVNEVARVGNRIVTAEQLIARIYDFEALIPDERYKVLTKSVDYLVHVNLLELEAERIGCEIKKLEIELEVKRQVSEMKKQVQDRYGGAVPWEEWLKSQNLTQERLEAYLGSRARIILLKRLIVNYFETSTESYDLAHILCKTQATAQDVWVRLQRGANWDDLAVKESQDIGSANQGGKLPRHYKGDGLASEVADAAYALKDGEYSKPVKSAYGWHIVKRNKTNMANTAKFFDRRPEFLAFPDVDDDRFGRWVRVVMSRGVYTMEFRVPGVHCEPDKQG